MKKKISKYLIPEKIKKVEKFPIQVRSLVEGFITGLHKSPSHGFNVEFKEHKQYYPGDDIKYLDWRVFAKTDKYYIKRYEEESNLFVNLILDCSLSMNYKSEFSLKTKYEYSKFLTGAILYLATIQGDSAGVTLFSNNIIKSYTPHNNFSYINEILLTLEKLNAKGKSKFKENFIKIAGSIKHKSLIIIISDFLGNIEDIINGIKYLKGNKNEIILFVINDKKEKEFSFKGNIKFIDIENREEISINASSIRDDYLKIFNKHYSLLKNFAVKSGIDYFSFTTDLDYSELLYKYLIWRNSL